MTRAEPKRIVFAGTPQFAVPCLRALIDSPHQVVAVYTQPDRKAGRGQQLTQSPVKQVALEHKLPVVQPRSLRKADAQAELQHYQPDIMIVAAYGLILPEAVLTIPSYGCLNVHASLLPRWRGAAPIQHALLAGDVETGITFMKMDAGLDTGDMLSQHILLLPQGITAGDVHDRLAQLGANYILEVVEDWMNGLIISVKQRESQVTYAAKVEKTDANIDWTLPAINIQRMVNAYNPWPIAYSYLNGERIRFYQVDVLPVDAIAPHGTIVDCTQKHVDVACGTHLLRLGTIQLAGGKALPIADILKSKKSWFQIGHRFQPQP